MKSLREKVEFFSWYVFEILSDSCCEREAILNIQCSSSCDWHNFPMHQKQNNALNLFSRPQLKNMSSKHRWSEAYLNWYVWLSLKMHVSHFVETNGVRHVRAPAQGSPTDKQCLYRSSRVFSLHMSGVCCVI